MSQLYNKMREWRTPSEFTLDQCIQTGVDNPGIKHYEKTTGIVAGDEESYEVSWTCSDLGLYMASMAEGAPIPEWGCQPIIWPTFSRKLHENEINWAQSGSALQ